MDSLASCTWRNVCKEGFQLEGVADAGAHGPSSSASSTSCAYKRAGVLPFSRRSTVFLDLPSPWEAIESAKAALKVRPGPRPHTSGLRLRLTSSLAGTPVARRDHAHMLLLALY